VPRGAIYYHATRSRHEVEMTPALRRHTEEAICAMRGMLHDLRVPPPANDARCPNCSLMEVCLPEVVGDRHRLRGLQGQLFVPFAGEE